jgi:hypothetical protein
MADGENKSQSFQYSDKRFKYIGFDVYPGKVGDIFKSEEERKSLIQRVRERMARGKEQVRDRCTLMESRISGVEKGFLTAAAVLMIVALFLPWYSGSIPISYEQIGTVDGVQIMHASDQEQRLIGYVTTAFKEKQDRALSHAAMPAADQGGGEAAPAAMTDSSGTQEPAAEPGATDTAAIPAAAVVTDSTDMADTTATAAATDTTAGENTEAPTREVRVLFVDTYDPDSLRLPEDLQRHTVAYFAYNAETKDETFKYGAADALTSVPGIMAVAQQNDSLVTARRDKIQEAADKAAKPSRRTTEEQRQAKVDSIMADTNTILANVSLFGPKQPGEAEMASRGIVNDNYSMTGIGAISKLGDYLPLIFSSGTVLVITGILLLIFYISIPVLAVVNMYALYGLKRTDPNEYVLKLKKWLRYNWIPVFVWLAMFILSFVGAAYGFDSAGMLQQVGSSYGVATFIGLSSFGFYLVLMSLLITALKGKEI